MSRRGDTITYKRVMPLRHGETQAEADNNERHCDDCGVRLSMYNMASLCYACRNKQHRIEMARNVSYKDI